MKVNDIFYFDKDYANRAKFCNENKLRIVEIEPDENGRRFQIQELSKPTQKQIAQRELTELKQWFVWYDIQVAQYQRCQRLGENFDKDIDELDTLAKQKATRIKELCND